MTENAIVHVRISGLVQGVGFRAWTQRRANALRLAGWVRNCADGDVEALFSGPADALEAMLASCREGPRGARVSEVRILEPPESAAAAAGSFTIRSDR